MSAEHIQEWIQGCLGPVRRLSKLHGGDISEAYKVTLHDGRTVFAKTHREACPRLSRMFAVEAAGLEWLGEVNAIRTPVVLAKSPDVLVLEWIEPAPAGPMYDVQLGRGLAKIHRKGAEHFGAAEAGFIGTLSQLNTPRPLWSRFYVECRLVPQLKLSVDAGHASVAMTRGLERLFANVRDYVDDAEPPSRLHGDLWAGNRLSDSSGAPVLIDPAAYGGHREMDLAMMRLFGGFSERVFDAYTQEWPLAPGAKARIPLYQLYPLLVHLNLFGKSYLSAVERALEQLVG